MLVSFLLPESLHQVGLEGSRKLGQGVVAQVGSAKSVGE